MLKQIVLGVSGLASLALACLMQPSPSDGPPPPHEKAKKGPPGPAGDLRRAYDLLRKLRAEARSASGEERLREWTDRASKLYREGLRAFEADDPRLAHEYGAAAHDLARAVDHALNAARFDRPDPDLPPPPSGRGPEGTRERTRRDLRHAYDRIREARGAEEAGAEGRFYLDSARDFYRAARRDAEAGHDERAGELARAAEALTHVPEHLGHAADRGPDAKTDRPEPKKKKDVYDRPEPKKKKDDPDDRGGPDDLPPPL